MALRMPCPTKRQGSPFWYYRRRLPADVRRILAGLPRNQWPANWYKSEVLISLKTESAADAKARCPAVAAAVERQIGAFREGPKPLTPKQIAALSGQLYMALAGGLEDDPVLTAEQWQELAAVDRDARAGKHGVAPLLIVDDEAERREYSMEERFGRMADAVLRRYGIVTDAASRWRLIERLSLDRPQAAAKLARNADGDFGPDAYAQRFPALDLGERKAGHTLSGLADAWQASARALGKKVSVDRFPRKVHAFAALHRA